MFVDLGIHHEIRMRHTFICGLPHSTIIFSTFSHKRYDFREKVTEHKMCDLIFSTTLYETFLILGNIERDKMKFVYRSLCKVPFSIVLF